MSVVYWARVPILKGSVLMALFYSKNNLYINYFNRGAALALEMTSLTNKKLVANILVSKTYLLCGQFCVIGLEFKNRDISKGIRKYYNEPDW